MKFTLDINNTKVIISTEQLEAIANALDGAEVLENKYLGNNLGLNGTNYLEMITAFVLRDVLKAGVMSDTEYEAKVFITKQYNKDKT